MATVSTKIEVEGARQFKKDFSDASLAVKSASSELKYFSTELDRSGRSTENYAKAQRSLEKAMTAEGNAIKILEDRIAALQHEGGESAERQITKLTGELYKHKTAQAELQHQMDTLGDQAEETGNQFGDSFATDVASATVFLEKAVDLAVDLAKKIIDVGKGAVQYNAKMEGYEKTIEAFFKTSGQSASQASKNTKDLIANQKALSAQIGIGTDTLLDANKMLIASGVEGDKAQEAVAALGKAIIATGGGKEELSRMAQNLQQISNTGKASTQDLKQFAMAGIDVYGLLADSTGKSVDELKEMDITFDDIVSALGSATTEGGKFFEASQVGASTLNGQISLLQSEIQEGLGTAFLPVNDALKNDLIPAAREFIEQIDWDAVGKGLASAVGLVTDFVHGVQDFMDWYNSVYGEPAQVVVDGFTASQEELNKAFAEGAGNVVIFGEEMAGALEASKGLGNHMRLEFDGFGEAVDTSLQDTAREVREYIEQDGWNLMSVGITSMDYLAQGMDQGSDKPKQSTEATTRLVQNVLDQAVKDAQTSGGDFMVGFALGMSQNQDKVETQAKITAEILDSYLGFSVPDKGPLSKYESWMPDFVSGLAKTMKQSEWMMADAAESLAQTITNNSVTNTFNMTINGSPGQSVNDLADAVMIRIQQATDRRSAVWA